MQEKKTRGKKDVIKKKGKGSSNSDKSSQEEEEKITKTKARKKKNEKAEDNTSLADFFPGKTNIEKKNMPNNQELSFKERILAKM